MVEMDAFAAGRRRGLSSWIPLHMNLEFRNFFFLPLAYDFGQNIIASRNRSNQVETLAVRFSCSSLLFGGFCDDAWSGLLA
jgi:hypothetical protein